MATLSGLNSNGLNFGGLASGIDTDTLIAGLTKLSQAQASRLTARQKAVSDKADTYTELRLKLVDLQLSASRLGRAAGGAFDGRTATSSDATVLTTTAGPASVPGTYQLTVGALAKSHQISSAGFADPNAAIKQGTLSFRVGSNADTTVTIDGGNGTLQGLADAINAKNAGVRASVINDGSATPYRLVLTADATGAANAITVTNNLSAGTGASIDPAAQTVQAAADASVTVGSGPGALTVSSASNTLTGVVPGVSLNLLKATPGTPVTVSVAADSAAAAGAVDDLVTSYNEIISFINDRTGYDAETQAAGLLLGDRTVAGLADDIAAAITTAVPGLNPAVNRLSAVGLSFADDGKLVLDRGKLDAALSGPNAADVKRLFAVTGQATDPAVSFVFAGNKTKPTPNGLPYQVEVTAAATRGAVTAGAAPAASTVIDGTNNALRLRVNGAAAVTVTLASNTYTAAQLAAEVQRAANAVPALANSLIAADLTGGLLRLTSQQFGTASSISFDGGSALAALGFTGAETGTGTNVVGRFLVNGLAEAATGSGQVLTGTGGNANTDGLQVRATGAITSDLSVTEGIAGRLGKVLTKYLDANNGRLKTAADDFQKTIDDFDARITAQNDLIERKKEQLTARFAAMETAVNKLKGLGNQLGSLAAVGS